MLAEYRTDIPGIASGSRYPVGSLQKISKVLIVRGRIELILPRFIEREVVCVDATVKTS